MSEKSPSMWEKVKIGAKGFVSGAMDYLPRGLIFGTLALGGMEAIAHLGIADPFHLVEAGMPGFAGRLALSTVVGAGAVGIMEGVRKVHAAVNGTNTEPGVMMQMVNAATPQKEREREQEIEIPAGIPSRTNNVRAL